MKSADINEEFEAMVKDMHNHGVKNREIMQTLGLTGNQLSRILFHVGIYKKGSRVDDLEERELATGEAMAAKYILGEGLEKGKAVPYTNKNDGKKYMDVSSYYGL